MKKLCFVFLYLSLLFGRNGFVFSYDNVSPGVEVPEQRGTGEAILHGVIAGAEILLSNGILTGVNHFLLNEPWALPKSESVHRHLTAPWEWEDTDGFKVNNIGHPFHGSVYYNASRANGFGFYESLFFSGFGSFTWEAFGESNQAAINDVIVTVAGSLSLGEIFYRLYAEAYAAGIPAPLAAIFNPAAGLNHLLTGWKPPNYGKNLYELKFDLGIGYARTHSSISTETTPLFSYRGYFANMGISLAYGNPFEQDTRIPFKHFEFAASIGLNNGKYIGTRVLSDGYLFSFSPVYTESDRMSTGLSLHMDFVSQGKFNTEDSTVDQFSNALDWTIKYKHLFSQDASFSAKFHAGLTFYGSSEYKNPARTKDLKNHGAGLNSKLFIDLEHKKFGKLEADVFSYVLWSFPETSAISKGTVFWLFTDVTYSYFISKHFSVGITDSFSLERGSFSNFPDTHKYNNELKMFVAWNL